MPKRKASEAPPPSTPKKRTRAKKATSSAAPALSLANVEQAKKAGKSQNTSEAYDRAIRDAKIFLEEQIIARRAYVALHPSEYSFGSATGTGKSSIHFRVDASNCSLNLDEPKDVIDDNNEGDFDPSQSTQSEPLDSTSQPIPDPIFDDPEAPHAFTRAIRNTPKFISLFMFNEIAIRQLSLSKLDQIRAAFKAHFHTMYVNSQNIVPCLCC